MLLENVFYTPTPQVKTKAVPLKADSSPVEKSGFDFFKGVGQLVNDMLPRSLTARVLYEPTVQKMAENRLHAVSKTLQEPFPESSVNVEAKTMRTQAEKDIMDRLVTLIQMFKPETKKTSDLPQIAKRLGFRKATMAEPKKTTGHFNLTASGKFAQEMIDFSKKTTGISQETAKTVGLPKSEKITKKQREELDQFITMSASLICHGKEIRDELRKNDPASIHSALLKLKSKWLESVKQPSISFAEAPQALLYTQTLNSMKYLILKSKQDGPITLNNYPLIPESQKHSVSQAVWDLPILASDEEIRSYLVANWTNEEDEEEDTSFPPNNDNLELQLQRVKQLRFILLEASQQQEITDEISKLVRLVVEIRNLLQNPPEQDLHEHMQKVRETIHQALLCPAYQFCKEDETNACVHFLHLAASQMTMQAEGMSAIESHGKELMDKFAPTWAELAKTKHSFSCEDFASILDEIRKNHPGFRRDHTSGKVAWSLAHPKKCLATMKGQLDPWASDYNSFRDGNANIRIGTFLVEEQKINFSLGPTPTGDELYKAYLQFLENKGQKEIHLQQTHEHPHIGGEMQRRLLQKEIAEKFKNNNWLIGMPLDGKAWKSRGEFKDVQNNEDYYLKLSKLLVFNDASRSEKTIEEVFLAASEQVNDNASDGIPPQSPFKFNEMPESPKEDNGFFIPEKVMSVKEVKNVLVAAQCAFKNLEMKSNAYSTELLNKARLLNFNLFLGTKGICNLAKEMKKRGIEGSEASLMQACKQDVDRGVLINVLTIIAAQHDGELSLNLLYELIGLTFTRAEMVDDRLMVESRFDALSTLLHLIGDNLKDYLEFLHLALFGANNSLKFEFTPSTKGQVQNDQG